MGELLLLLLEVDEVEELLLLDEDRVDELLLLLLLLDVVVTGSTTYSRLIDLMPTGMKPQKKNEGKTGLYMLIAEPSFAEGIQNCALGSLSCWHVSVMLPAEMGVQRRGLTPAPEA